jgi:hypothetical protein
MSTPIQRSLAARPHNDHQLFYDHYLDFALPDRADWQSLPAKAEPIMEEVHRILTKYQPSQIEALTKYSYGEV